jgi:uncharacterized phosphosugar-binding protein
MKSVSYASVLVQKILELEVRESEALDLAAAKIFESLKAIDGGAVGRVWHLFGSGHSHMAVEEAFHRAGGLIQVNPWLEEYMMPHMGPRRSGGLERLSGVAQIIFDFYKPLKGEVLTIISNSGINSVSVELAEIARKAEVFVIAITCLEHSKASTSRHADGKKLFEVSDLVIDTGGVIGDAALVIKGLDVKVGPLSSALSILVINSLSQRICERFAAEGLQAPVYLSANVAGGDARNRLLEEKFRPRIRRL